MELRNIKSFIKVAEFENFSKAAETLGYAQSTITTQIQLLEDELGVSLFDRIGKKVFLSEKGRQFLAYANSMAKLEEEALETISNTETPSGILQIGIIESIIFSTAKPILEEFLLKCPAVTLKVKIGTNLELLNLLEKGLLDAMKNKGHINVLPWTMTMNNRPFIQWRQYCCWTPLFSVPNLKIYSQLIPKSSFSAHRNIPLQEKIFLRNS